ncbi:MAG: hypothetical protein Q4F17_09180 [Eubacteriales bacterium]|nr:hypothetical protein [Eubacteriales bacterium]
MKITVCVITILYGLLSAAAPLSQRKDREKRVPMVIMLCGGLLLTAAGILKLLNLPGVAVAAVVGALAVCMAAVMNGLKSGHFHLMHHVVRFLISCALVAGLLTI